MGGNGELTAINASVSVINRVQRNANSVSYKNNFGDLYVAARASFLGTDDSNNPAVAAPKENDNRLLEVAADYKLGALTIGGGYSTVDRSDAQQNAANNSANAVKSTAQFGAKYVIGDLTLSGLVAQVELEGPAFAGGEDSNTEYGIAGIYKLTAASGIQAMYANSERNQIAVAGVEPEAEQFQITYYYDFSKRTRTYAGFNRTSGDKVDALSNPGANNEFDVDSVMIGVRHNF